jgi:hypothetical protein
MTNPTTKPDGMTDNIHSCSYYCDRPECIKAQRDAFVAQLEAMAATTTTDKELREAAERVLGDVRSDKGRGFYRGAVRFEDAELLAAHALRPATAQQEAVAWTRESATAKSEGRYEIEWLQDVPKGTFLYTGLPTAQQEAVADRKATIEKIVALCQRIPGSTVWNAAEFMYDELIGAAPPAAPGVPDETLRQAAFEALTLIGQHAPLTTRTFSSRRLLGALCNHLESLAASPSAPGVPDGWKLVPVEPTPEMIDQGARGMASWQDGSVWPDSWEETQVRRMRYDASKAWRYMLAAAASPSAPT